MVSRVRSCAGVHLFKGATEPLKASELLNPAHVLQVHLQMDAVGAEVGYLVYFTLNCGVAVYRLRRSNPLIDALRRAASELRSYLDGLKPDDLLDLRYPDRADGGLGGVTAQGL